LEYQQLYPSSENLAAEKLAQGGVPKIVTIKPKTTPKNVCAELIQRSEKDRDAFLSRIITGDETWVHHYDPLTNKLSMEWHHQSSPCKKKFKMQTSVGKVIASIFWDSEEILLVEFLEVPQSIPSDMCR
jgi:hypothetical protein